MHFIILMADSIVIVSVFHMIVSWWKTSGMPPLNTARCKNCDINGGKTTDMPVDDLRSHVEMHIAVKGPNARLSIMASKKAE